MSRIHLKKKYLLVLLAAVLLLLPYTFAFAGNVGIIPVYVTTLPYWGDNPPILPCIGIDCTSVCEFIEFVEHLYMFAITLGVFALAPLLIAVGGIMMLISGSSPDLLGRGKKIITGTVIGIVFCLAGWIIVATFVNVLGVSGIGKGQVGGFGGSITCDYPALDLQP